MKTPAPLCVCLLLLAAAAALLVEQSVAAPSTTETGDAEAAEVVDAELKKQGFVPDAEGEVAGAARDAVLANEATRETKTAANAYRTDTTDSRFLKTNIYLKLGCYMDEKEHIFEHEKSTKYAHKYGPAECAQVCDGFAYFAIQATDQCFCSDTKPAEDAETAGECNAPCPGGHISGSDGKGECGGGDDFDGGYRLSVFTRDPADFEEAKEKIAFYETARKEFLAQTVADEAEKKKTALDNARAAVRRGVELARAKKEREAEAKQLAEGEAARKAAAEAKRLVAEREAAEQAAQNAADRAEVEARQKKQIEDMEAETKAQVGERRNANLNAQKNKERQEFVEVTS